MVKLLVVTLMVIGLMMVRLVDVGLVVVRLLVVGLVVMGLVVVGLVMVMLMVIELVVVMTGDVCQVSSGHLSGDVHSIVVLTDSESSNGDVSSSIDFLIDFLTYVCSGG